MQRNTLQLKKVTRVNCQLLSNSPPFYFPGGFTARWICLVMSRLSDSFHFANEAHGNWVTFTFKQDSFYLTFG